MTVHVYRTGMADYGISLNHMEIDSLFMLFDRDGNGFIDVDEFFIGVKGDLNDRRKNMVRMAFNTMDVDRSGVITMEEMKRCYDVSQNPDVKSGKMTESQALRAFMALWDKQDGGNGEISYDEFEDYYKGVSASIDGDDYFELMIRNAWRIAGGTGAAANTANKRVLVTNADGTQAVMTVNNELGMKPRDKDAVRARLMQQGVNAANVDLYGGLDTTEKAKKVSLTSKYF
jgi:Ca2+-binding EF-hand superfamily protein